MKPIYLILSVLVFISFVTVVISFVIQTDVLKQTDKQERGEYGHSTVPVRSNQWYSTIYRDFPTQPMFAFPLAYKIQQNGIALSYPTVSASEKTVFAPFLEDVLVGMEGTKFEKPRLTGVGDWSIALELPSDDRTLSATLVKGAPYVRLTADSPSAFTLQFRENVSVSDTNGPISVSLSNDKQYSIVSAADAEITHEGSTVTISNTTAIAVGVLPESADDEVLAAFEAIGLADIRDTRVEYGTNREKQTITSTYTFTTADDTPVLTALFPHQSKHLRKPDSQPLGTYNTLRGQMELYRVNTFTTEMQLRVPRKTFEPLTGENRDELVPILRDDIAAYIEEGAPGSKNYFFGTWIGKGISILQLADVHGLDKERGELIGFLSDSLIEALQYHEYDEEQRSFISTKPEFGNEELNDHHFHYGYFIRAAAILSMMDESLLETFEPTIREMVGDIATLDRKNDTYPFLRTFDVYEGHSWASGYMPFGDGNNQESSSEAVQAWYALYLWTQVTGDSEMETYAIALYNTEIKATYQYWFDTGDIYPDPYEHAIASIIWGGKVDFTTWFSAETNMIYGIQLLPFTPASGYLGELPDFSRYDEDLLGSGGSVEQEWGDLYLMWKSFYNPAATLAERDKVESFEGSKSEALFTYFLLKNAEE